MSSVINTGIFDQLEVDPKWAENRQFRLIDEEFTKISDQQFVENTDVNPIVKDILNNKECQNNSTLQKLREKVKEMNLDELADVLLPVLVERLSPADIQKKALKIILNLMSAFSLYMFFIFLYLSRRVATVQRRMKIKLT